MPGRTYVSLGLLNKIFIIFFILIVSAGNHRPPKSLKQGELHEGADDRFGEGRAVLGDEAGNKMSLLRQEGLKGLQPWPEVLRPTRRQGEFRLRVAVTKGPQLLPEVMLGEVAGRGRESRSLPSFLPIG